MATIVELRRGSGAVRCFECGKCSTLCPLSSFRDFSASRMAAIHDLDTDVAAHAGLINRCLTCGACESRCPQSVQFTRFVRALRRELSPEQRDRCPHGTALQAAARLAAAAPAGQRDLGWIGDGLRVSDRGPTALFVGCLQVFDLMFEAELGIRTIAIARAAIRLLNAKGIAPVIVTGERCCGHDLLWNGENAAFQALAEANANAFEERGVQHVVTACAECCRTWRVDYAAAVPRYRPRVEHITEFAARSGLKFVDGAAARVTFQDPCRLARHLGVTDAPRQLLAGVGDAELLEMPHAGSDARCCGTAGFVHCDADSRRMQEERLDDAAATGADVLLTACPKCFIHFACARYEDRVRHRKRPAIAVQDITTFVAERLAPGGTP